MHIDCSFKIVIAAASAPELNVLSKAALIREKSVCKGTLFLQACLQGREVLLVKTGIGPKKARQAARHLLDMGKPAVVITAGAAGALDPVLHIADVVISRKIISPPGPPFACDADLSQQAFAAAAGAGFFVTWGDCLSMNRFVNLCSAKAALFSGTRARIVDMESAALAGVLSSAGIPLLSVRAVSDVAFEDAADLAGIVACIQAAGLPGVFLRFLKDPLELVRAFKLMRDVSRASAAVAGAVSCLIRQLS